MQISFTETASRNITALAVAQGITPEQYLIRYEIDIANAVTQRGGIDALEKVNSEERALREEKLNKSEAQSESNPNETKGE